MGRNHKQFKYGDLNPATHPQTGRSLDPEAFSGVGNLTEAARKVNSPSFIEKLGFPLKGIVLRVEEESSDSDEGWGAWAYNTGQSKPKLWRCRVRIPELHAHLPIPETFGPSGLNSVMSLYPIFQAKDQDTPAPIDGEICYVDFGDRKRFEDPIYLGMVKSAGAPVDGGASTQSDGQTASEAATTNTNPLNSEAPPGDPVGQSKEPDPVRQVPTPTPPALKVKDLNCSDPYRRDSTKIGPSCNEFDKTTPGPYRATAPKPGLPRNDFAELGDLQMETWNNRGTSDKLVLASLKHTIQLMEAAFIKDTGITDVDVRRFVNDGYRSFNKQACLRTKYDACMKEWKRRGRKANERPFPVNRAGPGKHSSGNAVDFNADGTGRSVRTRTTALWIWLAANSAKFGWRPAGARFNPAEPWHYEFDFKLAQSLGLFPRNGVSETVPTR